MKSVAIFDQSLVVPQNCLYGNEKLPSIILESTYKRIGRDQNYIPSGDGCLSLLPCESNCSRENKAIILAHKRDWRSGGLAQEYFLKAMNSRVYESTIFHKILMHEN